MKHPILLAAVFIAGSIIAKAQLTIPSDGSDGALNITEDTVIDLSQAVTGTWDQNNSANAGKGVYDPEKWAVVFKYSSVNIEGHTTGSPEQLVGENSSIQKPPKQGSGGLASAGNVVINGIVSLKGETFVPNVVGNLTPTEPGPGGFRGGAKGPDGNGAGYGPGGSFAQGRYRDLYGNPQIIPLIGGSGAGSASAGGGCILIASPQTITVNGTIDADGGNGQDYGWPWASGGAVKLVATSVTGAGQISALGKTNSTVSAESFGRIRIEASSLSTTLRTFPETIGVPPANPPIIWPAANAPKARVVSVDAVNAPTDPTSPLVAAADVAIQNNNPVNIDIETRDFPIEGVVQLAVIPKFGNRSWLPATRISGDINVATWRVTTTLPQGFVTLQARATQP